LKRAFLRKVKPVSCSPNETAEQAEQVTGGVHRKARTSAAMFGLALSMGATSLVLPHHEDGATAAEANGVEKSPSSVTQVAALPQLAGTANPAAITLVEHVVREGQTLAQIARSYRVTVAAIAATNHIATDAVLKSGQVLQVPVASSALSKPGTSELIASADLNQVPAVSTATQASADPTRADRDTALSRLHQQRDKLRQSLAELRSEESHRSVTGSLITEPPKVEPSQPIAADQLAQSQVSQNQAAVAYRVQPGDTLAAIAQTHGVSEHQLIATNNLPNPDWIRISQSLTIPSPQAAQPQAGQAQLAEAAPKTESTVQPAAQPRVQPRVQPGTQPAPVARPTVPEQVAAAPSVLEDYQVSPGDTLAKIAQAHNVPQATLLSTNRISDPNVIFVGQVLHVPSVRPVVPTASAPSVPATVAVAPEAIAPVERSVQAVRPASELTVQPAVQPVVQPAAQPVVQPTAASPHYVDNLLAEVRALRAKHQSSLTTADIAVQQPIAVARRDTPTRAEQLAVVNRTNPVVQAPLNQRDSQPTVVATAPLGSESYAPLRQPLTGRTVSPALPPLPGAEAYLPDSARSNGFIWPAKGLLTSGFGWRWGRMHQGIDIAADVGTPVYAAADGVVEYSDWNSGGYGNLVDVRHADGSLTRYGHLNRSLVHAGQRVRQGEQIAEMGSTGYSTGPHLHFEVHPSGQGAVNPIAFLPSEPSAQ
jgi:murein DD-endopeptidase MepM/ murein hydrolase activator NlpD